MTVLTFDIDKNNQCSRKYNFLAVPTLIIFKEGKMIWRKNGISAAHEILEHLALLMD